MAYSNRYNPDALPAHAEPEQAAQILSQHQQPSPSPPAQQQQQQQQQQAPPPRKYSNPATTTAPPPSRPYSNPTSQQSPYRNKPPPPLPAQQQQLSPPPGNAAASHPPPPPSRVSPNLAPTTYANANAPPNRPPSTSGAAPAPAPARTSSPPSPPRPPVRPSSTRNSFSTSSSSTADASLFPLFKAVDVHNTGQLTERELRKALVNGDFTSFDPHTVRMMMRMFDADRDGSIGFDEFCGLWGFLAAWRNLFDRFDADRSGSISFAEYTHALTAFGYRLSDTFVHLLYATYDKGGRGEMSFDLFVQSCIVLKRMTDVFKKYDDDRDGFITLSFEEFLTEVLHQR